MRKVFIIMAAAVFIKGSISASAFDLSGYKINDAATSERKTMIENGSFETNFTEDRHASGAVAIRRNYGRNATGGLRISVNQDRNRQLYETRINQPVLPERNYRMTTWVRTTGDIWRIYFVFTAKINGKWQYERNTLKKVREDGEWTLYENTFTTRGEDPAQYSYSIVLGALLKRDGQAGEVFFDDIEMYEDVPEWTLAQSYPTHNSICAKEGKIRLNNVYTGTFLKPEARELFRLELFNDKQEKLAERFVRPEKQLVNAAFGALPAGTGILRATLLDEKNKLIMGVKELKVRISEPRPLPPSSCIIDEKGRAIVNGNMFMPLGIFSSFPEEPMDEIETHFSKLASIGVNTVHDYHFIWRHRSDAEIRDYLDMCKRHGLMVSMGLLRYGRRQTPESIARLKHLVNNSKDHPALLAWYIADEPPPDVVPVMAENRRIINECDPNHPVWLITTFPHDVHRYQSAFDVYSYDPYPIRNERSTLLAEDLYAGAIAGNGVPYWTVPQTFNWGNYQPDRKAVKDINLYREFTEPSENQILANTLLHACAGAKGFIFYSYQSMTKGPDSSRFEQRWQNLVGIVKTMKELEPFIMSDTAPVKLDVKSDRGKVHASLFKDNNGRYRVLAIGLDKDNEAIITVPGNVGALKPRYGKVTPLGNGQYRYNGPAISCDILE